MGADRDSEFRQLDDQLFDDIQQLGRIGLWAWSPADDEVSWSTGMYRILGLPASTAPALETFFALVCPDDAERVRAAATAARDGDHRPVEYRIVRPDGSERRVRHELRPSATPTRLVGTLQDITEQVSAAEQELVALRRARETQQRVWELATSPAVANGDVQAVARAATESVASLLSIERVSVWKLADDDRELRLVDLYQAGANEHSHDTVLAARDYPAYFAALAAGRVIDAHDARTDPRTREFTDGYLVPLGITSMMDSAIRVGGRVVGVVCSEHVGDAPRPWTATDITLSSEVADQIAQTLHNHDRRVADERLRALNADLERRVKLRTHELEQALGELETFSYSVAHDLRAPVRHVHGYAHLLLTDAKDRLDERSLGYVDYIIESCGRLGALIDALLELSRLGRRGLMLEDVDMNALVHEVWNELERGSEAGNLEFECADLRPCRADPVLVRQVWTNLLDNAIKYSAPRAQIRIEVRSELEGDAVWYHVQDNGVGFDPKHTEQIFGVFRRLHGQTEFAGNGVGLALVERIVRKHDGQVRAHSDGATGARVSFSLSCPG